MSHVTVERDGFTLTVSVDQVPVLETGLDLNDGVVLELTDLMEMLEEVSDEVVEYINLEE